MNYSKQLKEYRKKHNATQLQMAIKIGCSYSCYRNWEAGMPVGPNWVEKIEKILKEKGE